MVGDPPKSTPCLITPRKEASPQLMKNCAEARQRKPSSKWGTGEAFSTPDRLRLGESPAAIPAAPSGVSPGFPEKGPGKLP